MSYPVEFREMIIKKSLSAEMTQQQLVDEYGIGLSTLHKCFTRVTVWRSHCIVIPFAMYRVYVYTKHCQMPIKCCALKVDISPRFPTI